MGRGRGVSSSSDVALQSSLASCVNITYHFQAGVRDLATQQPLPPPVPSLFTTFVPSFCLNSISRTQFRCLLRRQQQQQREGTAAAWCDAWEGDDARASNKGPAEAAVKDT